ncbi:50S ribosomal protein L15 [Anaerotignum sp.]|uniref:50S ribosomal protein L15 n=1 Tax=Anaerotignum sp. TaxID=2039241 RepID=UPI00289DBE01|nr:50S ribosomal protein L15 [Anaerotignum sp.]
MNLCDLRPAEGSKESAWRRGRGHATGNGKTAGRGHKGQGQRSGSGGKCGFEGGQMPLYRRLPKRGFTCRNSKDIISINVNMLNVFENDAVVDIDALKAVGLVSNPRDGVKILGEGELERKLTIKVNQFSKTALEKIEAAGGKAEVI